MATIKEFIGYVRSKGLQVEHLYETKNWFAATIRAGTPDPANFTLVIGNQVQLSKSHLYRDFTGGFFNIQRPSKEHRGDIE